MTNIQSVLLVLKDGELMQMEPALNVPTNAKNVPRMSLNVHNVMINILSTKKMNVKNVELIAKNVTQQHTVKNVFPDGLLITQELVKNVTSIVSLAALTDA